MKISDLARINESTWTPEDQIDEKLDKIWEVMNNSIERGMRTKGVLPGGKNNFFFLFFFIFLFFFLLFLF